ncbi:hypothetical protein PFISCL1PPCAC_5215, partial [Pristionchus fissidentatus]
CRALLKSHSSFFSSLFSLRSSLTPLTSRPATISVKNYVQTRWSAFANRRPAASHMATAEEAVMGTQCTAIERIFKKNILVAENG